MRWLSGTARTALRERRVRLTMAGLALAAALSLGLSLALHPGTGGTAALAAAALQPIDVSFQTADAAPSQAAPSRAAPAQATPAQTGTAQGNQDVHSTRDQGQHEMSRAQAVALVQHRYRARVVRSHLIHSANGRPLYEFRLLASGSVWTVHIDAYSGAEVP